MEWKKKRLIIFWSFKLFFFFFQDTWQCNYGRRYRPSTQGSTGKRHTGF